MNTNNKNSNSHEIETVKCIYCKLDINGENETDIVDQQYHGSCHEDMKAFEHAHENMSLEDNGRKFIYFCFNEI